jgi:hypothetical protein
MRPNSQPDLRSRVDPEDLFKSRKGLPRGTADNVMERLFPKKRSEVDTSEERRHEVWDILVLAGVIVSVGVET